jgi:hypothetical protein
MLPRSFSFFSSIQSVNQFPKSAGGTVIAGFFVRSNLSFYPGCILSGRHGAV